MKNNSYKIGALIAIHETIINKNGKSTAIFSNSMRYPAKHLPYLESMARKCINYPKYKQALTKAFSEINDIPTSIPFDEIGEVTLGYYHKHHELNCK